MPNEKLNIEANPGSEQPSPGAAAPWRQWAERPAPSAAREDFSNIGARDESGTQIVLPPMHGMWKKLSDAVSEVEAADALITSGLNERAGAMAMFSHGSAIDSEVGKGPAVADAPLAPPTGDEAKAERIDTEKPAVKMREKKAEGEKPAAKAPLKQAEETAEGDAAATKARGKPSDNVVAIKGPAKKTSEEKTRQNSVPADMEPLSTVEALQSHISTLRYQVSKMEAAAVADRQRVNELTDHILKLTNHLIQPRGRSWWQKLMS